jgi:hypothetical protein
MGFMPTWDEIPPSTQKLKAANGHGLPEPQAGCTVTDLSIPLDLEQARCRQFDLRTIEAIFRELNSAYSQG